MRFNLGKILIFVAVMTAFFAKSGMTASGGFRVF
ncbi:hypothetical protein MNBD_BACTEROID05-1318, partial [hydrothermal vent metagenome]